MTSLRKRAPSRAPIFIAPAVQLVDLSRRPRPGPYLPQARTSHRSSHTDAMVGQLLTALANSRHAENTDIVFWSDHGFHLGEKFHWRKNTFWDQAVKVPLLVKSAGNPKYPVKDILEPVSLLDLAPTVLDLAGLPPFPQFEGVPLHDSAHRKPVEVYFKGGRATVANGWKIIDYDTGAVPAIDDMAAYWVEFDRAETNNVILPLMKAILTCQARRNCRS
ncbi:MAG: sulfatase-like hydrolase/transferase [Halioglobus sp.]